MVRQILVGFLLIIPAALIAYLIGGVASTQFVLAAHEASAPVRFTLSQRLQMTGEDLLGMNAYAVIIAIGFLIAFPVAALLKRVLPMLAGVAYPLAGAAAIGVMFWLMNTLLGLMPISGARSDLGLAAQILAGGVGGYVFARLLTWSGAGIPRPD